MCQHVFKTSSYFYCYTSLESLRYFWRPTGRLAGTKREIGTNAVLALGLSGFNPHRRANSLPET